MFKVIYIFPNLFIHTILPFSSTTLLTFLTLIFAFSIASVVAVVVGFCFELSPNRLLTLIPAIVLFLDILRVGLSDKLSLSVLLFFRFWIAPIINEYSGDVVTHLEFLNLPAVIPALAYLQLLPLIN